MRRPFAWLSFIGFSVLHFWVQSSLHAQDQVNNDSLARVEFYKALGYMEKGQDSLAERSFRIMFKIPAVLPDLSVFAFGLNQYHLGKYKQSEAAFQKYKRLSQANDSLKIVADTFLVKIQCHQKGYVESQVPCTSCGSDGVKSVKCNHCKGYGREYCPNCGGTGVVVRQGSMSDSYTQCERCIGKGVIECSVCKGTTMVNDFCPVCKGKRVITKRVECPK
jgi:hypothetical protein